MIKRQPRPLGLSLLANQLKNNKTNPDLLSKILHYFLKNTNLEVNKKKLTIETLAGYLNISPHIVMKAYLDYQGKLAKVMMGDGKDSAGVLNFVGFGQILEDQALVSDQLQTLLIAQNGQYKPFISSTVNDALRLKMANTDMLLKLANILQPRINQTNIQNNLDLQLGNTPAGKAIGINEALSLLQEQKMTQLSYSTEANSGLIKAHNLDEMPEVRATHQQLVLTDGIIHNPLNPTPEDVDRAKKQSKHLSRRQEEEGLDVENDILEP